jgi:hypothetical protein
MRVQWRIHVGQSIGSEGAGVRRGVGGRWRERVRWRRRAHRSETRWHGGGGRDGSVGSGGSSSGGTAGGGRGGSGGASGRGGASGSGGIGSGGTNGTGSGGTNGTGSGGTNGTGATSGTGGTGGSAGQDAGPDASDAGSDAIADAAADSATCTIGEVSSEATASNLSLFGTPVYFNDGNPLPAGTYRITYVDGCMKYGGGQGWTVNAYGAGGCCNWWLIGESTSDRKLVPPGTIGYAVGSGAYANFTDCETASRGTPSQEFEHTGGRLGVWLQDSPYTDNLAGENGRQPTLEAGAVGGMRGRRSARREQRRKLKSPGKRPPGRFPEGPAFPVKRACYTDRCRGSRAPVRRMLPMVSLRESMHRSGLFIVAVIATACSSESSDPNNSNNNTTVPPNPMATPCAPLNTRYKGDERCILPPDPRQRPADPRRPEQLHGRGRARQVRARAGQRGHGVLLPEHFERRCPELLRTALPDAAGVTPSDHAHGDRRGDA